MDPSKCDISFCYIFYRFGTISSSYLTSSMYYQNTENLIIFCIIYCKLFKLPLHYQTQPNFLFITLNHKKL